MVILTMAEGCTCPNTDLVHQMLEHIALRDDAYFGGEQRGTQSLTIQQKSDYVHETLHKSAQTFITRYGKYLTQEHFTYFYEHFQSNSNLMYHVRLTQTELSSHKQTVKNRRFTAMKEMLAAGDYFSDEQMKHRDPLLYEQMIGQHLTDDEIKAQSDNLLREHCGFSTMLLEQMDSKGNSELYDRQVELQDNEMEENDSDSDDESEMSDQKEQLSMDEKLALKEEFLHTMQERFLSGNDKEFDYRTIDENTKYDDITQQTRDAEDTYFDDMDDEDKCENEQTTLRPDEYDY